jgi:hypothetical protein
MKCVAIQLLWGLILTQITLIARVVIAEGERK